MPRTSIDWRSASKEEYEKFRRKYSSIKLTFDEWRNIIYTFNDSFKSYILETGEKARLPGGLGEFSINKKKRRHLTGLNNEFINLPVDWKKSKEKGKKIYIFNHHTEGYFFGWQWFRETARFQNSKFWYFKPTRVTSRLLGHYIKTDNKYQHIYREWLK